MAARHSRSAKLPVSDELVITRVLGAGNVVPASHYAMPGDRPSELLVTVTFEEDGRKTIMTLRHVGIPPETISDCEAGWSESFEPLEGIL